VILNIIHLSHRLDRLVLLKQELESQYITAYKLWDGIIYPGNTATGISRAHKHVVQHALENDLPEVLIGEDDLKFTAPGAFNYFLQQKPPEFDLYLGGISYGKLDNNQTVGDFAGLLLYIVDKRFYQTFLSMPEEKNLDRSLKNEGKYIVCDPQPVIEHGGHSDHLKVYMDHSDFFETRNLFGR
jgi:hypothetical protein